jgi:hypothetical protein
MRDTKRLAAIRKLPCIRCGGGPSQAAHSNFGEHGKGKLSGNALMITKQESGKGKIDPVIALFNAVALMSGSPDPAKKVDLDEYLEDVVIA